MVATPTKKQLAVSAQQRRTKRIVVTKTISNVKETFARIDENNIVNAQALINKLVDFRQYLERVDGEIQPHLDDSEMEADVSKSMEYDEALADTIAFLNSRIQEFRLAKSSAAQIATSPANNSQPPWAHSTTKLPKYEPERYDGDPLKYKVFWDDFSSSVDSRTDLSVTDKFKLLKRAWLTGEAQRVADGYLLTAENYAEVKAVLQERFGDPDEAIFAHFKELVELQPASHDLSSLQRTRDKCEAHIRSLNALGLGEDVYGCVFVPILLSKFPKYVKMEVYRQKGSVKWSLTLLRTLLKDEIAARERTERTTDIGVEKSKFHADKKRSGNANRVGAGQSLSELPEGTATTLVSNATRMSNRRTRPRNQSAVCPFCKGNHAAHRCERYPDSVSRQAQLGDRCFACLRKGHMVKDCRSRRSCYYCKRGHHHYSLCHVRFGTPDGQQNSNSSGPASLLDPTAPQFQPSGTAELAAIAQSRKRQGVGIVKSAVAPVRCGNKHVCAQLVFDDCSTISFARKDLLQRLGARPVSSGYTSLGRFLESERRTFLWNTYELDVVLRNGQTTSILVDAIDNIVAPIQLVPLTEVALPDVRFAQPLVSDVTQQQVDILIGLDHYYQFIGPERYRSNGLTVVGSSLGDIVSGYLTQPGRQVVRRETQLFIQTRAAQIDDVGYNLEKLWQLEDIGVTDNPYTADDDLAQAHFDQHVRNVGDRYEVRWPYKSDNPEISDTYGLALGRLRSLHNKLMRDGSALQQYDSIFKEQLKRGILEHAPSTTTGKVFYIPHHAVVKQQSATTKVRVVYDASAKSRKEDNSLNECIHRGPVILNDLAGLLLRFRLGSVAMTADVEKAFHMVQLAPEDRDVTRFLWLKDLSKPLTSENVATLRFTRVPFGVVASPFLLGAVITHHLKSIGTECATKMLDGLYVDNVLVTRDTPQNAVSLYREAKRIMSSAGMNLRQWYSNSSAVRDAFSTDDRGQGTKISVLGVQWDTSADVLSCPAKADTVDAPTKRQVLQALATLFDPCGWFCPVSIRSRVLMQKLWKLKLAWDDVLPTDLQREWRDVKDSLNAECHSALCHD